MRGEYEGRFTVTVARLELPPRARRIPIPACYAGVWEGTTSAHAENTSGNHHRGCPPGNYLRARGEYVGSLLSSSGLSELPPRTRRIPMAGPSASIIGGTTSAHAENTPWGQRGAFPSRNYLRARGEYACARSVIGASAELPPRTRRILENPSNGHAHAGTTSAHAENTFRATLGLVERWNYLRARGEYTIYFCAVSATQELPPRTRRILPTDFPN